MGITKKDKENEEKDKEAIRKAILGEGINPNAVLIRHVAASPGMNFPLRWPWMSGASMLPSSPWMNYSHRNSQVPPAPPQLDQPTEEEIDPLSQPIQVGANRAGMQDGLARMVRELNLMMSRAIKFLEDEKDTKTKRPFVYQPFPSPSNEKKEPEKKTALQVINEMVKARLTQEEVDIFDDHGVRGQGTIPSPEYQLLKERGLKVLSVGIGNLRFDPTIEQSDH